MKTVNESTESIPKDPDDRIAWIIKRAQLLDKIRDEEWVADTVEDLWNNPEVFENDDFEWNTPSDDVDEEDVQLFRLGVLFGTDYEHFHPRPEDYHDE